MMQIKSKLLITIFLIGIFQNIWAQEEIIKSYADSTALKSYCFYPSTLRMLNLKKNKDYYKMVENINKILIYSLDSTAIADKSYIEMMEKYENNEFEEYAIMLGGNTNFYIYGKKGKQDEFVGAYIEKKQVKIFYLYGKIGWHKIPALLQSISQGDMFNIYSIISPNDN